MSGCKQLIFNASEIKNAGVGFIAIEFYNSVI